MKKVAIAMALALATATPSYGYETDDFGFPVVRSTARQSSSSFASSRSFLRTRSTRSSRVQYCPPAVTTAVRVPAQSSAKATLVRQASSVTKAQTVSVSISPVKATEATTPAKATSLKTTPSTTQAPVAQPSS